MIEAAGVSPETMKEPAFIRTSQRVTALLKMYQPTIAGRMKRAEVPSPRSIRRILETAQQHGLNSSEIMEWSFGDVYVALTQDLGLEEAGNVQVVIPRELASWLSYLEPTDRPLVRYIEPPEVD